MLYLAQKITYAQNIFRQSVLFHDEWLKKMIMWFTASWWAHIMVIVPLSTCSFAKVINKIIYNEIKKIIYIYF